VDRKGVLPACGAVHAGRATRTAVGNQVSQRYELNLTTVLTVIPVKSALQSLSVLTNSIRLRHAASAVCLSLAFLTGNVGASNAKKSRARVVGRVGHAGVAATIGP